MYALPRNQRIAFRFSNAGLARLAELTGNWDKKGVAVVFATKFEVERAGERWWMFDLITGATMPLTLETGPRATAPRRGRWPFYAGSGTGRLAQPYDIEPGQAFVTWRRNSAGDERLYRRENDETATDNVTIYINHWFADGDPALEDLAVARDAWFAKDLALAKKLIEKIIPYSYELFLACVQREFNFLTERTL